MRSKRDVFSKFFSTSFLAVIESIYAQKRACAEKGWAEGLSPYAPLPNRGEALPNDAIYVKESE